MTLFHQPWWLDLVAPNDWAVAECRENGRVVATLPYVLQRRMGMSFIKMPPLTQVLGPIEPEYKGKYANRLSRQKDIYVELINALPKYDLFRQSFHPGVTNWLPFYWSGFAQTTRYTYRLDLDRPVDELWSGTLEKIRTDVRKAERQLTLREESDPDRFMVTVRQTFDRQGVRQPYDPLLVRRLFDQAPRNARFKAVAAVDINDVVHAVALFLGDEDCVYYLMGGADPKLRGSGCQSMLAWSGVKWAAGFSRIFDFEGSVIEGVERFVRGFGAQQSPYFQLTSMSRRMGVLWHGAASVRSALGLRSSVFSL